MTTLVTGGTGFLGRHLVELLVAEGDDVRVLARPQTDVGTLRELGVATARGDITVPGDVRRAAAGCGRIFHLAGVVSHQRRDLRPLRAVNVDGTRCVLESAEREARVVHVSSVATVGWVASPADRADERNVLTTTARQLPYAATKRQGELLALAAPADGLDVVVANPGYLLGPGDVNRVSTWPVTAYLSGALRFTTSGRLSFVDARDVAAGLRTLASLGQPGERVILTSEQGNLAWRDFFRLIGDVSGVRRHVARLPRGAARAAATVVPWPVKPDTVRAATHWWFASPAKARRELGFETRPLVDTIADTIAAGMPYAAGSSSASDSDRARATASSCE